MHGRLGRSNRLSRILIASCEAGSIALDLVTRQPLFVHEQVADDLVEYYEREEFDFYSYKTHPYLPVSLDDRVFEYVFISGD